MKVIIGVAFLVVGISANIMPSSGNLADAVRSQNTRIISDTIINEIEGISQGIKEAGLDPLLIRRETFTYGLPVPVLFNAAAFVENLLSTGLSNIVVNNMNYSILLSRLNFDIELPFIHFSTGVAAGDVTLFGNKLNVQTDGRVDIRRIRVVGEVRVNIGIISGISVSRVTINFTLGSINTNLRLAIQGQNYSHEINTFLSSTIPETLQEFRAEINELIEIILFQVINDSLQGL